MRVDMKIVFEAEDLVRLCLRECDAIETVTAGKFHAHFDPSRGVVAEFLDSVAETEFQDRAAKD